MSGPTSETSSASAPVPNASFIADDGRPLSVVAADGSYIYWTSYYANVAAISRANIDGTGIVKNFVTLTSSPNEGLAVDGSYIYWSNYQGIGRAPIGGGTPDETWLPIGSSVQGLAVDSHYIYWTNPTAGAGAIQIGRATLDKSVVTPNFIGTTETGGGVSYGLAVDGTYIYWANQSGGPGVVGRAVKADGSSVMQNFVSVPTQPGAASSSVAVDGSYVYWTNNYASTSAWSIGRANIDGSNPNPSFTTMFNGAFGLAVDGLSSTAPPPPSYSLTVALAGAGSGTVTGSGISCPGTCSSSYASGTAVTLTATAVAGSTFAGWSGACSGTGPCNLTMTANQDVTATFTMSTTHAAASCTLTPVSNRVMIRKPKKDKHAHPKTNPGYVALTAKCDQNVKATLKGTLTEFLGKKPKHGRQRTKLFGLATVNTSPAAAVAKVLKMKVPAAAVLALEHGVKESAVFTLTASNANGTTRVTAKIVSLRL